MQDPLPFERKLVNFTAKKTEKTKEEKIEAEKRRLSRIFKGIKPEKKKTVEGLIERAAFMRVTLEELEADLNENGLTEMFSQGDQKPYERKRPKAELYNSMNTNYQKVIKQLTDLLPKDVPINPSMQSDGFEEFVKNRND